MAIKILSFGELINKINSDLGNFCSTFAYKRKDLARLGKAPKTNILFKYDDPDRDWAINEGGGTEIQYHIFLRDDYLGYGLGFNTQYVPFANEMSPKDWMRPYGKAFLQLLEVNGEKWESLGFDWIEGEGVELLKEPQDNAYTLYGKRTPIVDSSIDESFYNQMIDDLKHQMFEMYKQVFALKVKQEDHKQMIMDEIDNIARLVKSKHNVILQGAPGTGKTYNTAAIALRVLGIDMDYSDHKKVMERYESLQNKSIFFTTFHQSLDYEDFVEGLKPVVQRDDKGNNVGVVYEPHDGIFKMACHAVENEENADVIKNIDLYLQSIKGYENKKEIPTISGKSSLYVWWNEGNKTISTRSTLSTSNKNEEYTPSPLNIEKVKMQAIGEGTENNWVQYAQAFINAVKKASKEKNENNEKKDKPVVLIIDEINRGNVSKIFGELITLLESDKRAKSDHPITVTLPYSKLPFSVPDQLYIIGTMNTTDRSTGTLDYALRRRFAFVTLLSKKAVIEKHYDEIGNAELKATAVALFKDIKEFISDPKHLSGDLSIDDLMVGHSYFMAKSREELSDKMEYEVKPLISEYINDGILNVKLEEKKKAFAAWLALKPIKKDSTADND